jgi:hypothetical protein
MSLDLFQSFSVNYIEHFCMTTVTGTKMLISFLFSGLY